VDRRGTAGTTPTLAGAAAWGARQILGFVFDYLKFETFLYCGGIISEVRKKDWIEIHFTTCFYL
jgi:hypothetical protein